MLDGRFFNFDDDLRCNFQFYILITQNLITPCTPPEVTTWSPLFKDSKNLPLSRRSFFCGRYMKK